MKSFTLFSSLGKLLQSEVSHKLLPTLSSISFTSWTIILTLLLSLTYKTVYRVILFISTKPVNLTKKTLEKFVELPSLPLVGPVHHFCQHRNGLVTKWSEKYGNCVRTKILGRNILCIHDPVLLKSMLTTSNIHHLEKEPWSAKAYLFETLQNGILGMPAKKWLPHRKILNSLFTYDALKGYVGIYQKHAENLVEDLKSSFDERVSSSANHSYRALIHTKLLDIITEIIIGKPFESVLGHSGSYKAYKDLESILSIVGDTAKSFPWNFFPGLWHFHPLGKKVDTHIKDFENAITMIIKSHVPRPDSKFALDLMKNSNWSDEEIMSEIATLTITGHETMSSTLCFLFWMLAMEQTHQVACQQEIDDVFEQKQSSSSPNLTIACFSKMKYLERCIKETLRLFPAFPIGISRELKDALTLGEGMELKAGTVLTCFPYVLHRDPKNYPEPEKFDPDRFLPENVRSRHIYTYLPFSAGARNCIGWRAAMLELTVVAAVILRNFHIRTTDTREDIKPKLRLTLVPSREPNLIFETRNK